MSAMQPPKIFIIILNYNGKDLIKNCLESVFHSDYCNFEAVVVDNDSKDGSFEIAKKAFPRFHFIKNEKNVGFSSGNNIGIRFALEKMTDYIFLLNNDALLEKDTLTKLVEKAESENIGISGPLVYNQKGKIWFSGGKIKWFSMRTIHENKLPEIHGPYNTDYVSGCAMLIKKEVFKKTGLFSEDYFLYYEDADFCLRAQKNGFKCMVTPNTKVTHLEKSELELSNKIYWLVVSGLIFFKKNTPSRYKLWINSYKYLRRIKNLIDNLSDKKKYAAIVKKAYNDYRQWEKNHKYPLSS